MIVLDYKQPLINPDMKCASKNKKKTKVTSHVNLTIMITFLMT